MKFKAIATSINRTLTDDDHLLDLASVEVIRDLETEWVPVLLITSMDYLTAGSLSVFFGASGIVAAEGGAVLGNYRTFAPPIIQGRSERIERGLRVLREGYGKRFTLFPAAGRLCSALVKRSFDLEEGNALLNEQSTGAHLLDSGIAYLLVDADVDKGRGLREAARLVDLAPQEVVAIGDHYNDLEMLRVAGYGIAVANAPPGVQETADYVCSASYGEGFCEGVHHVWERLTVGAEETNEA